MNLDDISRGSLCVIDTNLLLYAEQGFSRQAQSLLKRCSEGELIGMLPQPVWQELIHKLMLAEAMMLGEISGQNPAKKLAKKPETVKSLNLYKNKVLALVDLGLGFQPCTRADLLEDGFKYQQKYGLLTNDSLVLATAVRLKADVIATSDSAFQQVNELQVAMPSDVKS